MTFETIIYQKKGGVGRITLNRPEAMNAITSYMLSELTIAVGEAGKDADVQVVAITGAGRAFCAGVDLKSLGAKKLERDKVGDILDIPARDLIQAIRTAPKPVVALVNGFCFTGAMELMLACDIVLAAEDAKIGDTHAKWGLRPTWGMTARLPRRVGFLKAKEMSFTAEAVTGREAERIGLINRAVPAERLEETFQELARSIMANSRESVAAYKSLYNTNERMSLDMSLELEFESEFDISDTGERLGQFRK
ncbi:MAG TPA: enoyl-CoA hydratase/isomerase family protein [Spirochaetota bacterium]|nr:enoyl-CoA hydratase/isomerase family protein [Spirochaetota bacterium]HRS77429.1 enoyl-CoA hydratase/isomerase family protein [Spirochaetota bacterium]HRT75643.1 enoyl-CoA hydratase/isomerase family protein [Spirochaetota bacterium]